MQTEPSASVDGAPIPATRADTGDGYPANGLTAAVVATAPGRLRVIKRNGTVVPYDESKIAVAMTKAFLAVEGGKSAQPSSGACRPGVRSISRTSRTRWSSR